MKQDRWKLYLKALWGAVIVLLVISSLVAGLLGGSNSLNAVLAGSAYVIINLGILTLLLIIVVRLKEWIEDQIASAAGQKSGAAGGELQMLRQSVERIEAKVDRIEKVLDGISE
ncbi:MAG: hypothetical protein PHT97_04695 [Methanoculleus sp.]|uniref:hypothetical protein n=1 Tax=unclassified Methanoculleus TaxID=2619537 RepID=UPI0025DFB5A8|nr:MULTISPECIES: hypothetical protein [unclassified Methanoculleus]MCK9318295.1 hypothetical protein [Methanoculleus sp.]MDD2253597.1 hypothetical protein [Methanoculleus sp.]MDD3216531.1 hypothetical protein [Methanoculleus sp.]MDD4314541.1 hypothetical protein [Methanoculleus sp.]MDD4470441.1 hypothetical protein [Methanoculleus sp.]